jgi:hypothetical protein
LAAALADADRPLNLDLRLFRNLQRFKGAFCPTSFPLFQGYAASQRERTAP